MIPEELLPIKTAWNAAVCYVHGEYVRQGMPVVLFNADTLLQQAAAKFYDEQLEAGFTPGQILYVVERTRPGALKRIALNGRFPQVWIPLRNELYWIIAVMLRRSYATLLGRVHGASCGSRGDPSETIRKLEEALT